jgi:hypothetical protein
MFTSICFLSKISLLKVLCEKAHDDVKSSQILALLTSAALNVPKPDSSVISYFAGTNS